jgi:spore coat protein A
MRRLTRRGFLGLAGGVAAIGAGVRWLSGSVEPGLLLRSEVPLPTPFTVPLPIPPVLTPSRDATVDRYEVTQRVATVEILPGVPTEIWGYDGRFPGPTIVSRSGRPTVVRHHNRLPAPTVVHLHGGHTPAASDGFPTDLVLPAGLSMPHTGHGMADPAAVVTETSRDYEYPMRQRAATLWYHDHRMDFTGPAVWRGLAGFHLVHDDEEANLPLPAGDRDLPLMITDRAFGADGAMRYPAVDQTLLRAPGVLPGYEQGVLGDVILVNGAPWPVADVDAAHYRLRLLNASNARRYRLALDPPPPGGAGLVQIGSDGGLLDRPQAHDAIELAPAERFDVVIDFARYPIGQQVTLVNQLDTGDTGLVMRFRVNRRVRDDTHVPNRLTTNEPLRPDRVTTRDFVFRNAGDHRWTINGREFDPSRPETTVRRGDVEIWRFTSDFHHPIHLHLAQAQVLSRNGEPPGPYDAGWKDTIDLRPSERVAIIARFSDYAGRYVLHCHNLEHEDMGMMATYQVI